MVENSAGGGAKPSPARRIVAVKPCDFCKSAPALLFCRKDTAYFCMACDAKLHGQTKHERVWMCEVCGQSPACVTCKADAAALCVTCDRDIHSANPLARRHVRIPVVPFYDSAETVVNSTAGNVTDLVFGFGNTVAKEDDDDRNVYVTNIDAKVSSDTYQAEMKSADLLTGGDRLFNFDFGRSVSQFHDSINDAVVPVQSTVPTKSCSPAPIADYKSTGNRYEIDFNRSNSQSHSHSVSSSSMDAGVVLEENSLSEISNPFMLPVNAGGLHRDRQPKQLTATDREARVLRYREKRKKRRFEKKVRYASRKAYAEMRSRIKGRFAKRTELTTVLDADRWSFMAEANGNGYGAGVEYGVVPSF